MTARSRAEAVVAGSLAGLARASLAQVTERAALQTRIDRKYLVPVDRFAELVERLSGRLSVLEIDGLRGFADESVYFDTPDLLTYRQHLQGRRRRYKVRTRAYLDSSDCAFEVKLKGRRDQTVKARLPYPVGDRARMTPPAQAFLADRVQETHGLAAPRLDPVVITAYRRATLADLGQGTRLTCDVDLTFHGAGRIAHGPSGYVLVESKSPEAGGAADRALRGLGLRPLRMSKYCIAVALLHPGSAPTPGTGPAALLRCWRRPSPGARTPTRRAACPRRLTQNHHRRPMTMRRPFSVFAATCLALAVLLAGCGGGSDNTSTGQQAPSTTSLSTTTSGSTAATGSTDAGVAAAVRALRTAARAVPQGKAFDLDTETRGGQRVWEVSVKVDAPRALRLAALHQDGQVTDLDLDTTDAGTVIWEVDFRQRDGSTAVVGIHARTGKVMDRPGD